ncbi:MAG: holo-ACP synthase [Candidatus Bipolaricaulia bacterium]
MGIDLVEVARIEGLMGRWGEHFLKRIFTERELKYSLDRRRASEHLAARFAAKEALAKAAQLHPRWREIEVLTTPRGVPYFSRLPQGLEPNQVRLSLSHAAGMAIAIVLIEDR